MSIAVRHGDCRTVLPTLPAASVHCVVTSPPYWGLRDYGCDGQLGLEPDFNAYVAGMVAVFREVRRVLRDDGTLWINLGDSYFGTGKGPTPPTGIHGANGIPYPIHGVYTDPILKSKDLCGIPWRVAFALQADGWYLRQDIIWSKPNPMPESVTDRCTKAHEYLFLLSKRERYYYDAEAVAEKAIGPAGGNIVPTKGAGQDLMRTRNGLHLAQARARENGGFETRNKRSVWEVTTQPFSEAHFATFPPALIEPCIKAGTSERGCCGQCGKPWVRELARNEVNQLANEVIETNGVPGLRAGSSGERVRKLSGATYQHVRGVTLGWSPSCTCAADPVPCTVLDPFAGAGTTGLVADRLQRNAILIELNPEYADMATQRIRSDAGMFAEIAP